MPSSALLSFTDPYEYQRSVRASDFEMIVTAPCKYRAKLKQLTFDRLWMQRSWQPPPYVARYATPKGRTTIGFKTDDHPSPLIFSGITLDSGHLAVASAGAEGYQRARQGASWGSLSLTPDDLAEAGRALAGRDLAEPTTTRLLRPPPRLMERLQTVHKAAVDLAETTPGSFAHPEVARAMEQSLTEAMVACLTADATIEKKGGITVMRRFEEVIRANPDRALYLTEVCRKIHATDRTLRAHCQAHLGMSPHRYLWLRRMHLARRALAQADAQNATVTEIANDFGFGELGRFAVQYRLLFGETPSVTLRQRADGRADRETRCAET